jgi:PKD repeat protein
MKSLRKYFIWFLFLCGGILLSVSCDDKDWEPAKVDVTADFDFSLDRENAPAVLTLTNKSKGGYTYFWKLPGGKPAVSMEKDAVIAFSEGGTFDVTLSVCNGTNCQELTKTVTIKDPLPVAVKADFSYVYANANDYSPAQVTYTDQSIGALTWLWTFGNGDPATSDKQNPGTVTYASGGKFPVLLKASNQDFSEERRDSVKVYPSELLCSSMTEQVWVTPLTYGPMTIGAISFYLDKERINSKAPEESTSGYKVLVLGAAMSILTAGKTTEDMVFQVPASWDWDVFNGVPRLQVNAYYMGYEGYFHADITTLEKGVMSLSKSVFDGTFTQLIMGEDPSGQLFALLSLLHDYVQIKP